MSEGRQSLWDMLFSGAFLEQHDRDRERKVIEYICYRVGEGEHLREVLQEEYVRRHASPVELDDLLDDPRLVESAHQQMLKDFASGELDPKHPPSGAR